MDDTAPGTAAPSPETADGTPLSEADVHVTTAQPDESRAQIRVAGELTEDSRRPLIRAMTDLMLNSPGLERVELELCDVTFMNSAGMSILVQLERMAEPRGIQVPLVLDSGTVARPLQVSGLWRRFTIIDRREGSPPTTHEGMNPGTDHR
ncbi:STAS domain-containing protein [Modestobacter roseus]|uniref:Stage II sporulation protein AA (Anti-sigma F factor antagonist) n=1 Tax=Modestobacter roseus TaxID=1181884 RepID=A0A562IWW7_9ACTN|nr:STAS domain-containing protein [Modestobacter roseus]MQA34740.1 STAS domain-containing protein [Modestobacter roseus]TWH75095.1 stage II sporulation protein AA (anti-sigma F factor antagonist) [Modestobacter roseus]